MGQRAFFGARRRMIGEMLTRMAGGSDASCGIGDPAGPMDHAAGRRVDAPESITTQAPSAETTSAKARKTSAAGATTAESATELRRRLPRHREDQGHRRNRNRDGASYSFATSDGPPPRQGQLGVRLHG
jgi:hypothetical protein